MNESRRLFGTREFFVPATFVAARALKGCLWPPGSGPRGFGRPIGGPGGDWTVAGELHDIGKNLLAMTLEGTGFGMLDLGVDKRHGRAVARAGEAISLVKTDDGGRTWYGIEPQLEP